MLQRLLQFAVALLQSLHVHAPFLRFRHGRVNEQAHLHLVPVAAHLVMQRVAVVDILVGHYLAGLLAPRNNAERRRLSELLAILKALK